MAPHPPRHWRTHSGIDIKAEEGDAVKTAADGVVKEVRYDDLMGVTVVITHEDGYETQYSCLQQEPPVCISDDQFKFYFLYNKLVKLLQN